MRHKGFVPQQKPIKERGDAMSKTVSDIASCENQINQFLHHQKIGRLHPGYMDGSFTLDEANYLRYRIFRRYGDQHVDMISTKMAFQYLTFFLTRKVLEH